MTTIEQKYEALKIVARAQVDALIMLVGREVEPIIQHAHLARDLVLAELERHPELNDAWTEVGTEMKAEADAELAAEEAAQANAEKQGYPNAD